MLLLDPNKIIVYRSQAEQISDQFWYSSGYCTATKIGDFMIILVMLGTSIITGFLLYGHFKFKWNHLSLPKFIISTILFLISSFLFLKIGYHFLD